MAESGLDDFFAKKDKSKKKSKSKINPDDIPAQQGDKPVKKKKSKNVESEINPEQSSEDKRKEADAEWEEIAEEQETDYSGLRIQTLQISGKEEANNEASEDVGENGENENDDEESGPWNKKGDDRPAPVVRKVTPKEPKPQTPVASESSTAKVQGGKYVPPGRRNNPDGAVIVTSSARRKPKVAPNIQSDSDFPMLGGDGITGLEFEEVRSGGRQYEDPTKKQLNLQLDNKFDALGAE